jgi:hypothetical protein
MNPRAILRWGGAAALIVGGALLVHTPLAPFAYFYPGILAGLWVIALGD